MRIPNGDVPFADAGAPGAFNVGQTMSGGAAAAVGNQLQEFGNALTGAGSTAVSIAADMQEQVNQVALMNAMNKARGAALDLEWGQDGGYRGLVGEAAIKRPDGVALPDEYGQKLRDAFGEIEMDLGNDRQKLMFQERSGALLNSFKESAARHMHSEFKAHTLSVADGTLKLSADEAARSWNDPDRVTKNVLQVKTAIAEAGRVHGWSNSEVTSRQQIAASNVHASVLSAALQSGNVSYAAGYMRKFSGEMTADDLLKANGLITKQMDVAAANTAIKQATETMAPRFAPTDTDRAFNILIGTESGGRQFDRNGKPLSSSAGAIGVAQVMPKTAPEAAKMAGLPWDEDRYRNDPAYNRALGKAYFARQLQDFGGNLPLAYAAYNAGPGATKAAMKVASAGGKPDEWLSLMPAETQAYVKKNMREYATGGGAPQMPSELEFVQDAVSRLGPNARPELVEMTRRTAEHQYGLIDKAQKARGEAIVADAMRALESNGGRYSALPVSLRSQIPAKEVDNLMSYGARVSKGDDVTNAAVYLTLTNDAKLRSLSDNEFYRLRGELSQSDWQHFAEERDKLISGKAGDKAGDLNTAAISQTLGDRLRMLGRDPTPKDGSQEAQLVGAMHKAVRDSILSAQAASGKKMTDAEVEKHIDGLFARSVTFRNTFLGMDIGGLKQMGLMTMAPKDIPGNVRDKLLQDFAARGIENPSETDLLGAYWKLKLSKR